jgi:hypothetical protein
MCCSRSVGPIVDTLILNLLVDKRLKSSISLAAVEGERMSHWALGLLRRFLHQICCLLRVYGKLLKFEGIRMSYDVLNSFWLIFSGLSNEGGSSDIFLPQYNLLPAEVDPF